VFKRVKIENLIGNTFHGGLSKALDRTGIKAIVLQHGASLKKREIVGPAYADELILWGKFWEKRFADKISKDTRTVSLGCPRFDEIARYKERNDEFYKKLGFDVKKKAIVFLSCGQGGDFSDQAYQVIIRGIGRAIDKFGEKYNILIKLHPAGEKPDIYYELIDCSPLKQVVFLKRANLYELLKHSDVAISASSTTLLEAMAFNIPVIQFNPDKDMNILEFPEHGGGVMARDSKELIKEIQKNLKNPKALVEKQNEFLDKALKNVGKSAKEIVEYLLM